MKNYNGAKHAFKNENSPFFPNPSTKQSRTHRHRPIGTPLCSIQHMYKNYSITISYHNHLVKLRNCGLTRVHHRRNTPTSTGLLVSITPLSVSCKNASFIKSTRMSFKCRAITTVKSSVATLIAARGDHLSQSRHERCLQRRRGRDRGWPEGLSPSAM